MAQDYLRPAAVKAGILAPDDRRRFGFHNLRHSLASYLVTQTKTDCQDRAIHAAARRHRHHYTHAIIPEDKRYLTRVLDSLDSAFADFDTETAKLDLPNMQNRKPEAIKRYLEFRLRQFKMLLEAVEDCIEEKYPATGGHS
jgi:hypothetical protein